MLTHTLELPHRPAKPRTTGLTMIIDNGLPAAEFADVMASGETYIDYVKFGWGTALVSPHIQLKIETLREHDVPFFFGGTLFEKHIQQNRFEDFVQLCRAAGVRTVEVSNGTLPISNDEKCSWIAKLADDFTVISEVGFKQADHDDQMTPSMWAEFVEQDLASGASLVIAEARESGTSGIASSSGDPRADVLTAVLSAAPVDKLVFEAPTKSLQTYLITEVGPNVNLGNIAPRDVVSVETMRLGLRSDTFFAFDGEPST